MSAWLRGEGWDSVGKYLSSVHWRLILIARFVQGFVLSGILRIS